ncbi:MAG: FlgD immunoglobulin-like domain containing protein, partial [Syntrophothermus sp.]
AVLDGISYGDTTSITTSVEEIIAGVKDYDLLQNYPNPFNPSTTLRYYLSRPSHIVLEIYSFIGEKVKELVNKEQHSGTYEITWNGKDENSKEVSSGVYFAWLKLTSPGIASKTLIHKLLLTK